MPFVRATWRLVTNRFSHRAADARLTAFVSEMSGGTRYRGDMTRLLLSVFLALLPTAMPAQEPLSDADLARDAVARGDILRLSEILPGIEAEFGGQVLDLELEVEDGLYIYEFEILTGEARLIEVEVNAATGEVLEVEDEDLDDEDDDTEGGDD